MTNKLSSFIVGIKNEDGQIVGTGFVVADKVIATCAHVVRDARATESADISVTFSAFGVDYATTVAVYDEASDIAILQGTTPLPPQATVATLCSPNDLQKPIDFYTYGYRQLGEREGLPATGKLTGADLKNTSLTLKTTNIGPGMSGSPVYIPQADRVVGIVTGDWVTSEVTDSDTSLAAPAEAIQQAWPSLLFQPPDQQAIDPLAQLTVVLPEADIPPPKSLPPQSRPMPHRLNDNFVDRQDSFRQLVRLFNREVLVPTVVVTGIGGMGKSQFATEFAYRYGQYFPGGVFWLNFTQAENVKAELSSCGLMMNLHPDFPTLKLDVQVELVKQAWQDPIARLLIFDNCESEELLDDWLPRSGGCRVLVTARRGQWLISGLETVPLTPLPQADSVDLLGRSAKLPAVQQENLGQIAETLGHLPLALHIAASYLAQYKGKVSPTAYLQELKQQTILRHRSFKQVKGISPTDHALSLEATFNTSYDATKDNDLARQILFRAACFAPNQPIPEALLLKTLESGNGGEIDPLDFEDALTRLVELGLIDRLQSHPDSKTSQVLETCEVSGGYPAPPADEPIYPSRSADHADRSQHLE